MLLASEIEVQSCHKEHGRQALVKSWLPVDLNLQPTCPCLGLGNTISFEFRSLINNIVNDIGQHVNNMSEVGGKRVRKDIEPQPGGRFVPSVCACSVIHDIVESGAQLRRWCEHAGIIV